MVAAGVTVKDTLLFEGNLVGAGLNTMRAIRVQGRPSK
jgi:hypothetical protein